MFSSPRTLPVLRRAPAVVAMTAVVAFAAVLVGGANRAEANPVLAANLRLMSDHDQHAGPGPALHTMVAPAAEGQDPTKPVSAASLAKRAGLVLDPSAEPVSAADNPTASTFAATAPTGRPHLSDLNTHVTPACTGTGTDGKRVQVIYAYEDASDLVNKEAVIRNEIANVDDIFAVSSSETGGGKRVRWVADANCVPTIAAVQFPAGMIANGARSGTYWGAVKTELARQGHSLATRKYLIFGDAPAYNPGICGLGDRYTDERPTGNYNDYYAAQYAMVWQACFTPYPNGVSASTHELVHTLGAVQEGSPNSSKVGHCTDDGDLMCYADGSTLPMRSVCPATHEPLLDCNNDDYFSTAAAPGTYLASNWNTANSAYLDTVTAMQPRPTVTVSGPDTATTGTPFTLTVSAPPGSSGYSWSGPALTGDTTGQSVTVNPSQQDAGPRTYKVTATTSDGWAITVTKSVTISAGAAPKVTLSAPTPVKPGASFTATATATGTGALTYRWFPAARCPITGPATGPTVTMMCSGAGYSEETFNVEVQQGDGQRGYANTSFVVAADPMTAAITGPASVQVGSTGTYTIDVKNVPDGYTVSWSDEQGWISGNESYAGSVTKVVPKAAGSNTLTALVVSETPSSYQHVYVDFTMTATAAPAVTITGPSSTPAGFAATYTANITPGQAATYSWVSAKGWLTGAGTGQSVTLNPTTTGTDTLTVTATLTGGAKVSKTLTVSATPALVTTLNGPTSIEAGKGASFTVTANRTVTTSWSTNRTDCALTATTGPSTTWTCPATATGPASVTATVTDTATKQVHTKTASVTLTAPVVKAATGFTITATGSHPVTLTGTLTNKSTGKALAGAPVVVQRITAGATSWSTAATMNTDTYGRATYQASAASAASYRIVHAGTVTTLPSNTTTIAVKVPTRAALKVTAGYPTSFSGSVLNSVTLKPVPTYTPVSLKVKWYGTTTWVTIANLKTDAYGKVAWKWNANRNGYFQLVYAGATSTTGSASTAPLVRIPTKVSMSVKSGRPDILTGRVLTGAGLAVKYHYVTLQYRPYGTATWYTYAKYKTGSTGYVTATVQPKKRMYYRWSYSGTSTGYLPSASASGYVAY